MGLISAQGLSYRLQAQPTGGVQRRKGCGGTPYCRQTSPPFPGHPWAAFCLHSQEWLGDRRVGPFTQHTRPGAVPSHAPLMPPCCVHPAEGWWKQPISETRSW